MPELLIEVDEPYLQFIEEKAKENHRSRRAQITIILEDYVSKEKAKA